MEESRKLEDLRVVDLRNELAKRNLDKNGVKTELMERLSKALTEEGRDVNTYLFDLESEKKSQVRKRRSVADADGEAKNNSEMDEEETADSLDNESHNEEVDSVAAGTTDSVKSKIKSTKNEDTVEHQQHQVNEETEARRFTIENGSEKEDVEIPEQGGPKEQRVKPSAKNTETARIQTDVNEKPTDSRNVIDMPNDDSSESNIKETGKEVEFNKEEEDSINLTIGEDEVKLLSVENDDKSETEKKDEPPASTVSSSEKESSKDGETPISMENKSNGSEKPTEGKKTLVVVGNSRSLWISGLSSKTRATDLKQLFSKYGKVVGAKIVTNAKTPGARCYGYVTMLSCDDAAVCMKNLHHTELHGRVISVEKAKDDATAPTKAIDSKKETTDLKKSQETKTDEKKSTEPPIEKKTEKSSSTDKKTEKDKSKEREEEKKSTTSKDGSTKDKSETKSSTDKKPKSSSILKSSQDKRRSKSKSEKSLDYAKRNIVPFNVMREQRERIRQKERERIMRQEDYRRRMERNKCQEIEQKQRIEAMNLAKERMKLKIERERIEREKLELLRIERENQRLERERLQREKEDLRRTQLKLEETRRAVKRSLELKDFEEERKRRASAERRHLHVPPAKKDSGSRDGGNSLDFLTRRVYDSSHPRESSSRRDHHSSRDKIKDSLSSRYSGRRTTDDSRSKPEISHTTYEIARKPDAVRYDRANEGEWRSAGIPIPSYSSSSSNNIPWASAGGNTDIRKAETMAPWARPSMTGPPADRWPGPNNLPMGRSAAPMNSVSNAPFRPGYANSGQSIDVAVCPYDRYDAYKQPGVARKY